MSSEALKRAMEEALAEYNQCAEHLAAALNAARERNKITPQLMSKITDTNKRCNELLDRYLNAYRAYYAFESSTASNN
jgi:hypothetical protein